MLASMGGKGANLIRLRDAGLPVPPFVVIDTQEYREFVRAHDLDAVINNALRGSGAAADAAAGIPDGATNVSDAAAASADIGAAFRRFPLPAGQRLRLAATVAELGDVPVAVRSSATAEDLPDLSFAGQQDTFLDVTGASAILSRIVDCWASLWTERAIAYRARAGISSDAIALAVVVQVMVPAEASGVMFTADPLTGHRGLTVVDAVFGLGEALVSGRVNPDNFVVERANGTVRRTVQGGKPVLSDTQLAGLVDLGRRTERVFGTPQDVEWVRVGDDLSIVQSRPITSLYPLPAIAATLARPSVWLSLGAFQGMLDPFTPLGQDVVAMFLAGAARVFGGHPDHRTNAFLQPAGERLWLRLDQVLRTPAGRLLTRRFLPIAEPGAAAILADLATEPAFAGTGATRSRTSLRAACAFGRKVAPYLPRTLARPERAVADLNRRTEAFVAALDDRLRAADAVADGPGRLAARLDLLTEYASGVFGVLLPAFGRVFPVGLVLLVRLRALGRRTGLPEGDQLALSVLRALPGNVTTEMDLRLWEVARRIRDDEASGAVFAGADPADLTEHYLTHQLPPAAQSAITHFLTRYGMRGVAEIDIGTRRWRDSPEQVLRTLAAYVRIEDPARAPDAVYERGRLEAHAALERLAAHSGRAGARQVAFLGNRLRAVMGARETPKFTLVRVLGLLRGALLASGAELVRAGVLDDPEDLFLLHVDDLRGAFDRHEGDDRGDLRCLVTQRRHARARELRRTRVPLVLVSDGRTFYAGRGHWSGPADGSIGATGGSRGSGARRGLRGVGVSPGEVEGVVRVVHDPRTTDLRPGEILVCRGTDPAWTPLFLTAAGLVTEVGGLMTHGSVVAREYGIPAVVGVGSATTDLISGQRIRLDGFTGTIERLD